MFDMIRNWLRKDEEPSPVDAAIEADDAEALRALLDRGCGRGPTGPFKRYPLHRAAEAGAVGCVRILLERGVSANVRDGLHEWTPLHDAASADAREIVELLLSQGASVDATDKRGETPLFYAKSLAVLETLVRAGASLDVRSHRGQYPFQYCAAYARSPEVLRFWLERGVPIDDVPPFGWPALQAICATTRGPEDVEPGLEMIEDLLAHGADVDLRGAQQATPLIESCRIREKRYVDRLLEAGADPNLADLHGHTALHLAVSFGDRAIVEVLLAHAADVNRTDRHHQTAIDSCDDPEIAALLEPDHHPARRPIPTPDQVIARLRAIPRFVTVSLLGCSEPEIDRLERQVGKTLPEAYKEFLRRLGHGAGDFLTSDHWAFRYSDVFEFIGDDEEHAKYCDLPEDALIFAVRNGCYWVFFEADGSDGDPPVFGFDDSDERSYRPCGRSLWEFLDDLVTDYEIWDERPPSR